MDFSCYDVKKALKDIFDIENMTISTETLKIIQPEMIKDAFRKKAKLYHPDRANIIGMSETLLNEKFKIINNSYQFLLSLTKENLQLNKIIEESVQNPFGKVYNNNFNTFNSRPKKKAEPKAEKPKEKRQEYNFNYNKYKSNTFYYSGIFPKRKLRLSEFLFYSKKIDWHTMIRSIVWQFQVRPRFGEIGVDYNYLDTDEVMYILKNVRLNERFGEACIRLGYLDNFKSNVILGKQKNYNNPIGKFYTSNNILSEASLLLMLETLKEHNAKYRI